MPSHTTSLHRRIGTRWIGTMLMMAAAGTQPALAASDVALKKDLSYCLCDQSPVTLYTEVLSSPAIRDDFHQGIVIAEAELDQMRAGFNIGGLDVDFGARLQTRIDNSIELVSVVNFTKAGADIVSQTFRNPSGAASQVGPGTGLSVTDMTPAGVELAGLADFSGAIINDLKGFTAALHNITQNAIVSGVVSNASGQNIQQRIDIDVRLNNIGALQAAKQRAAIVDSFAGILR